MKYQKSLILMGLAILGLNAAFAKELSKSKRVDLVTLRKLIKTQNEKNDFVVFGPKDPKEKKECISSDVFFYTDVCLKSSDEKDLDILINNIVSDDYDPPNCTLAAIKACRTQHDNFIKELADNKLLANAETYFVYDIKKRADKNKDFRRFTCQTKVKDASLDNGYVVLNFFDPAWDGIISDFSSEEFNEDCSINKEYLPGRFLKSSYQILINDLVKKRNNKSEIEKLLKTQNAEKDAKRQELKKVIKGQ